MSGDWHAGRSWYPDTRLEDTCPCPKAPCGLAIPIESCPEHGITAMKTIRQSHPASACPGSGDDQ